MNKTRTLWLGVAVATTLAVVSCGGGGGGGVAVDPTVVPDSAGVSTAAFLDFIQSLSTTDETSEPLTISDNFAVPDDETDGVRDLV